MCDCKKGSIALVVISILALTFSVVSLYKSGNDGGEFKFAVVDLQRVVPMAKDVEALKSERTTQVENLKKMAEEANAKIKEVKDEAEKKKISEDYLAKINAKKEEYDKVYAASLQESDQKLNNIINSVAEKEGVKVVLNKSAVISGGIDITDSVIDLVK